jgi:E3 ubiquitin-protein ligase SHPRH
MLAILFPHMFEEIEYLLPQEDDDVEMAEVDAPITPPTRSNGRSRQNAVAGPSRLAQ